MLEQILREFGIKKEKSSIRIDNEMIVYSHKDYSDEYGYLDKKYLVSCDSVKERYFIGESSFYDYEIIRDIKIEYEFLDLVKVSELSDKSLFGYDSSSYCYHYYTSKVCSGGEMFECNFYFEYMVEMFKYIQVVSLFCLDVVFEVRCLDMVYNISFYHKICNGQIVESFQELIPYSNDSNILWKDNER